MIVSKTLTSTILRRAAAQEPKTQKRLVGGPREGRRRPSLRNFVRSTLTHRCRPTRRPRETSWTTLWGRFLCTRIWRRQLIKVTRIPTWNAIKTSSGWPLISTRGKSRRRPISCGGSFAWRATTWTKASATVSITTSDSWHLISFRCSNWERTGWKIRQWLLYSPVCLNNEL